MKFSHSLLIMMLFSFIIQYYLMSYLMSNDSMNIENSRGKIYVSTLMALFMGLLEVFMYDHQYHVISYKYYILFLSLIAFFWYLYKNQIGVDERNYLNEMVEHHSMAILTSEKILEKSSNYKVRRLANQIVSLQNQEINEMKGLVKSMDADKKNKKNMDEI